MEPFKQKEQKGPLVFAHRGANQLAPENSLLAFEEAIRLGCDGIELDVRYTASGDVVVFHDQEMKRMTGESGQVEQCSLAEIQRRRLKQSDITTIPTLQEALALIQDRVLINLDVKKDSGWANGFEEKIVEILKASGLRDNIILSSFNPLVVRRLYRLAPQLRLGFIYQKRMHRLLIGGIPVASLHVDHQILSERYIASLKKRGLKVYAWTVDTPERVAELCNWGVDVLITNRPENFCLKNSVKNLSYVLKT